MGPPGRIAQYKAIETTGPFFGLQLRWPPNNIADTEADALARLFALPGSQYSAPEFSWKFGVPPGGVGFLNGNALGESYGHDLFVGAAQPGLEGGQLFHFDVCDEEGAPRILLDDPRLADLVADNLGKFDITESESLLFGRDFGVTTDIQTGRTETCSWSPSRTAPSTRSSNGAPGAPGPAPFTLDLGAKKQRLKKKLKFFATASDDSTVVVTGKALTETTTELAANQKTKVKAKLKRKARKKLAKRLDRKGKAKTKVEATATHQGCSSATEKLTVKLKN